MPGSTNAPAGLEVPPDMPLKMAGCTPRGVRGEACCWCCDDVETIAMYTDARSSNPYLTTPCGPLFPAIIVPSSARKLTASGLYEYLGSHGLRL
jgi:hypothetical protein